MPTIADLDARIAREPLLARALYPAASAEQLATLRTRAADMPLGLLELHARHDGCSRPGGVFALLAPIVDRAAPVPWLLSARWISIAEGERARESILDHEFPLADDDVVIGKGKGDHTWLVADRRQVIRALYWRSIQTPRGSHRLRCTPTANQTLPMLLASLCQSRGRFELQDRMTGDAEDERTLLFAASPR